MSGAGIPVNIVRLMKTFNFKIEALPNDLRCTKCKTVLKDAYQVACGCRFCGVCVDDLISTVNQFCPGDSLRCGGTLLSTAKQDCRANTRILKLTAKCPHADCLHECPLADIEGHLRVCPRMIGLPLSLIGMPAAEMSGHLHQDSRSHSDILIGMVANINRNMGVLKDEQVKHLENEMKIIKDESKSIKEENKSIKDENKSIKDENKSIKDEIKSIKGENVVLANKLKQLSEKLEQNSARITAVSSPKASNRDALGTEMEPVRDEIRSIKDQFDSMKRELESIQMGVGQLDDWLIGEDIGRTEWVSSFWYRDVRTSTKFTGVTRPYSYQLASHNLVRSGSLEIWLRIHSGPSDNMLEWPFRGAVTITVAHRDRREASSRQTRQCRIERPRENHNTWSDTFEFLHSALRKAGLDLRLGLRVSCRVVPDSHQ